MQTQSMPRSWRSLGMGILGLSLVIIIHECGHFLACKLFGVATPVFSIGFGPQLFSFSAGKTVFQIAALPLGGFVQIAENEFALQPYIHQLIILGAGILFNLLFTCAIFIYLMAYNHTHNLLTHDSLRKNLQQHTMMRKSLFNRKEEGQLIGPIGIIDMIQKSISLGFNSFLFVLAVLSLNLAFFNILPLPFFDGGKIAYITLQKIVGPLPDTPFNMVSQIFLYGMIMLLIFITIKDVMRIKKR